MKVLAIIPTYNEADILPPVLKHLHEQGVDTYVIDNWSTDEFTPVTWPLGERKHWVEKFPERTVYIYQWERILRRVEEVALKFSADYDWMMLHDADEIRRAPFKSYSSLPDKTLVDGIKVADEAGYNVINFQVFNFPPIDNGYIPGNNPEQYFKLYQPRSGYENVAQEKCWKVIPRVPVDLASTGGHRVTYRAMSIPTSLLERRLCPHKFIIKHYPIRSQSHGERKVFEERQKRWHLGERGKNWHTQYDGIEPGYSFLADPKNLIPY